MVALADSVESNDLPVDLDVSYDPEPLWSLRCAAPLCGQGDPVVLSDNDVLIDQSDRAEMRSLARELGWSQYGPRRQCPGCTAAHTDRRW